PYKKFPLGFWVAPNGVKPVVKHYLGTATNMTSCSIAAIKKKLIRSHLVVAWVGWFDGFSNHAIVLTGYHGNTLYYNDPWTGTKRSMSVATFQRHWALDGHRALSY
nr:papain-like cysteine protease family protein [Lactobacillus amylovorus]